MNVTGDDQNHTSSDDLDWEISETVGFIIEGVLIPGLSLLGIIGNILCVWTFNKKDVELKPSFANLLKCLSIFDTIFLASIFLQYSLPVLSEDFMVWVLPYLTPFTVPIIHISLTGSVYSVVAVALERFMTVCFPFTQCSMCHGLGYIIPIILFSVSYNFVKFFEIETAVLEHEEWGVDENGTNISTIIFYPINNATSLRADPDYQKYVVFVLNFVMMGLLPVILLSVLNFMIYRSISKATATHNNISSSHRRDTTMARLLIAIVIVFLCCHSTKFVVNFYEAFQFVKFGELPAPPTWIVIMVRVNHLLLAINSAINIVIYSFKDFKFRTVLLTAFKRKQPFTQSFRTSIRSSFGSTRYRSRYSNSHTSRVFNNHNLSSTEHIRTVETSLKESMAESDSSGASSGGRNGDVSSRNGNEEKKRLICDKNVSIIVNRASDA